MSAQGRCTLCSANRDSKLNGSNNLNSRQKVARSSNVVENGLINVQLNVQPMCPLAKGHVKTHDHSSCIARSSCIAQHIMLMMVLFVLLIWVSQLPYGLFILTSVGAVAQVFQNETSQEATSERL